jgi:metallo-beta-lactamase class B
LNAVSADGFRFTGDARTPSIVESFRTSIEKVETLPCDIMFAVHPVFSGMPAKVKKQAADPNTNPFINPGECRTYAADARKRLETRIAEEQKK